MILNVSKPIPAFVYRTIEKCDFVDGKRECQVDVKEEDAFTFIHPENFNFSDVYGKCEFTQLESVKGDLPVFVVKFEFEKNIRSFDAESVAQHGRVLGR